MAKRRVRRGIPEINSGSMADIAFLLLIFFLVTTTMDQETGIPRELPRKEDITKIPPVPRRNVLLVYVNRYDQLLINDEYGDIGTLKERVKEFIPNPNNLDNFPEKNAPESFGEAPHDFVYQKSKGIVALQNDRLTSYRMYIQVQDVLTRAFNELRNDLAQKKYGKSYTELENLAAKGGTEDIRAEAEQQARNIEKAIPMAISEAEPINF